MTCEMMRERLLDAELDELAGHGSSPVAVHVRGCARCRAVAEQLIGDTRRLAEAIGAGETHAVTTLTQGDIRSIKPNELAHARTVASV